MCDFDVSAQWSTYCSLWYKNVAIVEYEAKTLLIFDSYFLFFHTQTVVLNALSREIRWFPWERHPITDRIIAEEQEWDSSSSFGWKD